MLNATKYTKELLGVAVLATMFLFNPVPVKAGVFISVRIGPPALPVYVQPPCPEPGLLWTPGYWAYGPVGYYWVPGVWVAPPRVGLLWTPGYWGFASGLYGWHSGYWGPHVGFYGGINYGFGFIGTGFVGGGWAGGVFRYNTAYSNVNTTVIHNTYINRTVINNTNIVNRASFNGPGGALAQPSPQERAWQNEAHVQPTSNQFQHEQNARQERTNFASYNHGNPTYAAMDRVGGQHFGPNQRANNQQERIAQGVGSGQLNAGQTARIERREQTIHNQVREDRQANGGRLNGQERGQINREQNRTGQEIRNARAEHEHGHP